jgi:hypothetical protein
LTIQALTGEAATAEPRRCDYFKPDFFTAKVHSVHQFGLTMSDHVHQVGIRLPIMFRANISERLFERPSLSENAVNETGHGA